MRIRFSDCVLDTAVRELRRGGQVQPLSPKAFLLLEALAERRPHAVAHDDLRGLLWPAGTAGGTTLARLVTELRDALGDRARHPRFVRTLHRFGYAFCAAAVEESVAAQPAAMAYALKWGRRHVPLEAGENIIGRAPGAVVSLASSKVSRRHARILVVDDGAMLEDLGSKNGTCVGERCIDRPVQLHHGDRILVGPVLLVFSAISQSASTTTLRRAARRPCR